MIRKLRKRFVRIAVLVLTLAMVLVVGIVNTANLISVRNELAGTLSVLAENMIPARAPGMPEDPGTPDMPQTVRETGGKQFAATVAVVKLLRNSGNPDKLFQKLLMRTVLFDIFA